MKKIEGVYRFEKKNSSRTGEKIRQWRQRYARPILEDLWSWLEEQGPQYSLERALRKAIVYTLSHRVVLGRKSWLFAGSHMVGERPRK